eukprot:367430-Rhodomonas_salina.1
MAHTCARSSRVVPKQVLTRGILVPGENHQRRAQRELRHIPPTALRLAYRVSGTDIPYAATRSRT